MVRRKRRSKDWHHRVPDFKLVYCGSKNDHKIKTEKQRTARIDRDNADTKLQKQQRQKKIVQMH